MAGRELGSNLHQDMSVVSRELRDSEFRSFS
jgi:hypothetical protein